MKDSSKIENLGQLQVIVLIINRVRKKLKKTCFFLTKLYFDTPSSPLSIDAGIDVKKKYVQSRI